MNMKSKLGKLGKDLGNSLGEIADNIQQRSYTVAGQLEKDIADRTGVVGNIAKVFDAGKKLGEKIEQKGGVSKILEQKFEEADKYMQRLESYLFDGSAMDEKKFEEFLKNRQSNVEQFGSKAYESIERFFRDVKEGAKKSYRDLIPSTEERRTVYAGIGSAYPNKLFFRPDLDACVKFYKQAEKKVPKNNNVRTKLLDDIKASVSANGNELLGYYKSMNVDLSLTRKVNAAKNYLL